MLNISQYFTSYKNHHLNVVIPGQCPFLPSWPDSLSVLVVCWVVWPSPAALTQPSDSPLCASRWNETAASSLLSHHTWDHTNTWTETSRIENTASMFPYKPLTNSWHVWISFDFQSIPNQCKQLYEFSDVVCRGLMYLSPQQDSLVRIRFTSSTCLCCSPVHLSSSSSDAAWPSTERKSCSSTAWTQRINICHYCEAMYWNKKKILFCLTWINFN